MKETCSNVNYWNLGCSACVNKIDKWIDLDMLFAIAPKMLTNFDVSAVLNSLNTQSYA